MAKRYDPILCMLVDEPTKAQDAKVKDRLVKVPDSKLKDFEASLRSAGFKVVSKSDRGMTTHYQVEVSSSKKFTEADLREWANKIDAVCDKFDSVAPTTWNIGLTVDGKITAGLDVREMYVKDSASALDKAIKTCDASKADMDYWVGRYEKGCKSLIDAIKQGRSPIKTVQKAKQVISQDYDSHWKYLKDAFASYVVSTAKEEAKGDLSGMIDNTSKVEKREWKEFADREKKLMKAKNDALKSAEQAFK